ncbi:hypothetical protein ACJ5X2_003856 [Klebsiella quasipneumoniae]|uniref:DUF7740 domain-containing protein n=1 Tax=Klebsiella TaxID=570 RepID=UPI0007CC6452|nr:hypothetical protein [Klebsiella pneumoniae]QBL52258.1 hypothetical protein BMD99_027830 [Klebsiella sp. PO552]HCI6032476.1 hypothetical protein [Klebsiella quasipneumoniae subsp. quasipneumoniae]EIW8528401.1 hypothetical protein [Klebsiella pneumoniae]MDN4858046.1 hypothetical protein [Klebsiella pneumoniae]UZL65695.1 hypothetical protein JMX38_00320 [Klebsiella pneumoniae]
MKDVIPEEFFEKAVGAMEKSRYWEILDCPTVLNLAETQARLAGERIPHAIRTSARRMLTRVKEAEARRLLMGVANAMDPAEKMKEFENYRTRMVWLVASELLEAARIGSVAQYRKQRQEMAIRSKAVASALAI